MKKSLLGATLLAGAAILLGVSFLPRGASTAATHLTGAVQLNAHPLYPSSVVGTDFDLITDNDPSAFEHLEFIEFGEFEMPDKRNTGEPLVQSAYVFGAHFADGTKVGIALDKDFGSRQMAEQEAMRHAPRLGRLPALYRQNLKHIVIHKGGRDTTAFAEDKGHFFVLYSENASERIGTHDLEETFFHEGTHATIQTHYLGSAAWEIAKARDNAYITEYAKTEDQEDFAESALFAYSLIFHPERFPAAERARIEKQMPNRIAFFRTVFTGD